MRDLAETVARLRMMKGELSRLYKVEGLMVFGSVCRGEHGPASDLDILVDFQEGADLFDMIGLGNFLEERLGIPVDVVPRKALRPEFRDDVMEEAVVV